MYEETQVLKVPSKPDGPVKIIGENKDAIHDYSVCGLDFIIDERPDIITDDPFIDAVTTAMNAGEGYMAEASVLLMQNPHLTEKGGDPFIKFMWDHQSDELLKDCLLQWGVALAWNNGEFVIVYESVCRCMFVDYGAHLLDIHNFKDVIGPVKTKLTFNELEEDMLDRYSPRRKAVRSMMEGNPFAVIPIEN